jgi:hypothetical protein
VLDPTFQEVIRQQYDQKSEEILQHNADARSDLYAIGATLYHLLTARLPIDALKRSLDIWSGKPDPLPSPRSLNPIIPQAISDCLLKAMEIDRENRFGSAMEMQAALNEASEGEKRQEEEAKKQAWLGEQETLAKERRQTEQSGLQNQMQANTEILTNDEAATLHQIAADHTSQTENLQTQMPPAETQAFVTPNFAPRTFAPNANTGSQRQATTGSDMTEQFSATNDANAGKDEPTLIKQFAPTPAPRKKSRAIFLILPIFGLLALFGGIFGMWFLLSNSEKAAVKKPAVNAVEEQTVNPTPEEENPAAAGSALTVSTPTAEASPTPNTDTYEKPANTATVQTRPTAPRPQPTRAATPRPQPTRKVTVEDIITDN